MYKHKVFRGVFSAACLTILFYQIGSESLQDTLQRANLLTIAGLLALFCTLNVVQATRWWLIGKKLGIGWTLVTATELGLVGTFFNQLLPSSSGGDVIRAWWLTRAGVPLRYAVNSVVLDRVSALIAIGLIFCVGMPVLHGILGKYIPPINEIQIGILVLVLAATLGLAILAYIRFPAIGQSRIVRSIVKLTSDAKIIFSSPMVLFATSLLSLIIQISLGYIVWRLATDFGGKLNFLELSLLWPVVLILSFVPISIAGWGVREGAMVVAFQILGSPSSIALATSITFGILMILSSVPGGVIWFLSSFRKQRESISLTGPRPKVYSK